ncbi:MAG: hypothetical protein J5870_04215, partial [Clostridia bacterium]|nr:hypothetical protein [Clostridia bacterium]
MKISKKILSILLSVVMVLGVCAAGFTAGAYDAYLAVGGLEINLESDGSYYDGKVKYEAEIHTLTFDDFELRYEHCCINAMHLGFDLTIKGRAEFTDPSSEGISVSFHDSNLIIDC